MPWDDPIDGDGDGDTESEYSECPGIPEGFIGTVCTDIRSVVITGETLPHRGQAWQRYYFYGRIRPRDGLASLVHAPRSSPEANVYIFCGYIYDGKDFVRT